MNNKKLLGIALTVAGAGIMLFGITDALIQAVSIWDILINPFKSTALVIRDVAFVLFGFVVFMIGLVLWIKKDNAALSSSPAGAGYYETGQGRRNESSAGGYPESPSDYDRSVGRPNNDHDNYNPYDDYYKK